MNRLSIATHVVQKLNVPSLLSQCGDFAQRNYELIYDKHNFRDVEMTYTTTLLANTQAINLDPSAGRVAAVRANGKVLDPINAVQGMQYDPTIFERTGQPEVYEEVYDPVGMQMQIKVYPKPIIDTSLLVVAVRKISQMASDNDVPAIRNIDNVIIAYTEADMLERCKQYGMAKEKRAEADQKLADAIQLDTEERSNFPREVKQMSLSGGTLGELADAVCSRLKNYAPENRVLVVDVLRRNYVELYDMMPWREAKILRQVSISGGSVAIMPKEFESVLDVRQDDQLSSMLPCDMNFFFNTDPTLFDSDNTGTPSRYIMLAPSATANVPLGEAISFVSTSVNDTSFVFVKGEINGVEQYETVQLNGTTHVSTILAYDLLISVGMEVTTGDVSITGATTNTLLDTYPADTRAREYCRFMLMRNAGQSINVFVHGKRKVSPLVHEHDKPLLRGAGQALVYMTVAEVAPLILKEQGAALSAQYGTKAESAVKKLVDKEQKQGPARTRIVPLITDFNGRL